ncbi:HTH-type transcriptional repressor PurR [Dyadobacter sp. CECT 9275]|uniref:HTH-type transcriptional repressor PurR n=1 Tax=Dyadobacter helix TaxID=2822344 RepID=A0A916J9D4_9BACT|nr:LacI family DNA-binding transcriptional regulator [Dyadobacter sp. CECT 9275]CAG4989943.1 HTH-type transcriptional repressor PurR [Dyadobacter sp. CECT 9275]
MDKENTLYGVKEIARRANVSIATVDRVIHNRTGVSEKTRKKINEIIKELDYQPNILASRLASRKIITIGVLLPRVSNETAFWEAPLKGIQRAEAEIKNYGVVLQYSFFDLNDRASFISEAKALLEKNVNGVLLAPAFVEQSVSFVEDCDKSKIPYVFIDSDIPGQNSLSYIGPHLYQSGYVGAKLLTYRLKTNNKILVVNISKEIENYNYLQIEEGFRGYFKDHNLKNEIVRIDIRDTDYLSVARHMTYVLHLHKDFEAIFVTNSRVFSVATFLHNSQKTHIPLVGYDFLDENIAHLNAGNIDFLICHKPEDQGYRGIMTLYQSLVVGSSQEKVHFMPIDIITKENQAFYQN